MKKKVLFVLNSSGGGATQGILEMLKFDQQQHKFEAYCIIPQHLGAEQKALYESLFRKVFVIHLPWWNYNTNLPVYHRLFDLARKLLITGFRLITVARIMTLLLKHKIDTVYTGTCLNIEGAIAARLCGKKHIWHIKETFGKAGRVKFYLPDWLLRKVFLMLSTHVVVMTRYIRSFFGKDAENPKIKVVYDGVFPDLYLQDRGPEKLRAKLNVKNELLIAMVASLSSTWKNHRLFVDMASKLAPVYPDIRFVAFGPEPKKTGNSIYDKPYEYYRNLRSYTDSLKLGDRFIWAGFHADIPQLFQAIDILVHPCETEPFGRVIIEAMIAGKVVVVPSEGGAKEPVTDHVNGLIYQQNDVNSLCRSVEEIIRNKKMAESLGKRAVSDIVNAPFQIQYHHAEINKLI